MIRPLPHHHSSLLPPFVSLPFWSNNILSIQSITLQILMDAREDEVVGKEAVAGGQTSGSE